jgi:hypothetical protein
MWNNEEGFVGQYSLEDINRAICLFLYSASRRKSRAELLGTRVPTAAIEKGFFGYRTTDLNEETFEALEEPDNTEPQHTTLIPARENRNDGNPLHSQHNSAKTVQQSANNATSCDAELIQVISNDNSTDVPEPITQAGNSAQLAKVTAEANNEPRINVTLAQIIKSAEEKHGISHVDDVYAATRKQLMTFDHVCPKEEVDDFILQATRSEIISKLLDGQSENENKELIESMRAAFCLDRLFNGIQDTAQHPLNEYCDRYGVGRWPDLKIYPGQTKSHSLLPHQLISKLISVEI